MTEEATREPGPAPDEKAPEGPAARECDLTPPADVLAEIRRRQQDGPEAGVPLDEALDHTRRVLADER